MTLSKMYRLVNTAACSSDADLLTANSRLLSQVAECDINILRPCGIRIFLSFLRCPILKTLPTALAEATVVHSQNVKPMCGKLLCQHVPGLPLLVALMKEHDCRAGLVGGVV